MRIATYNVEWFNALFDDDNQLLCDQKWSGRYNVRRADQINALGKVFQYLDADAIMVIEAPDHSKSRNTIRALENFADAFDLRANRVLIGFSNDTQQEIALMYDPRLFQARHAPHTTAMTPRFDQSFEIDLDVDARLDHVSFSKPPLEVALTHVDGSVLTLIGVHLKSKAPHGARSPQDAMRLSIANRRKQLAQAIWLRQRITELLSAKTPLIVLGDFNDGPGLDTYEHLFGRSSIEIVMGQELEAQYRLFDPNAEAILAGTSQDDLYSAIFFEKGSDTPLKALLDYIFLSQDLCNVRPRWRIVSPYCDTLCRRAPNVCSALMTASDHFPVLIEF